MRAHLDELLLGRTGPDARNLLREYLQAAILLSLQRSGAMIPLAFHGGTALRFLHSIRRYSEDLDFALERSEADYAFRSYVDRIRSDLERDGYDVATARVSDSRAVHSALIKFPGLPFELGLSGHSSQAISGMKLISLRMPRSMNPTACFLATSAQYLTQRPQWMQKEASDTKRFRSAPYSPAQRFSSGEWGA